MDPRLLHWSRRSALRYGRYRRWREMTLTVFRFGFVKYEGHPLVTQKKVVTNKSSVFKPITAGYYLRTITKMVTTDPGKYRLLNKYEVEQKLTQI